jgi:DNA repair exonuclease SbcCD ATPase subunit
MADDKLQAEDDTSAAASLKGESPDSASAIMKLDPNKAAAMLREAMRQKREADNKQRQAEDKANEIRAAHIESVSKVRRSMEQLQARLKKAESSLKERERESFDLRDERDRLSKQVATIADEYKHQLKTAKAEVETLQAQLSQLWAEKERGDFGGGQNEETVEQQRDLEHVLEQLRHARELEATAKPSTFTDDRAPGDRVKPTPASAPTQSGGGAGKVFTYLFLMVAVAVGGIYVLRDKPAIAPVWQKLVTVFGG